MIRIYLSGGMKGMSIEKQMIDRNYIIDKLNSNKDNYKDKIDIFNPLDYFTYENPVHLSEKQIMNFELDAVRKSDIVIVNFNNVYSLGTMVELTIAYEHRIPIIGLNENNYELHAWQTEMCDVVFDNINKLINYVKDYYLIQTL